MGFPVFKSHEIISLIYRFAVNSYVFFQKHTLKVYALPPTNALINLTWRCNCVCYFCNAHFPGKEEITLNELVQILKQLPKGSAITFAGGEITLLKDFLPMMKLAAKHHKVQIITSGSTLNKNKGMLKELIDYGLCGIAFSVDAPNNIHNKIRGPEGLLQQVVDAIKDIKEIRKEKKLIKPLIYINTVILKESIPYLPEMVDLSVDLGIDSLSFGMLEFKNYDENDLIRFREKFSTAIENAKKGKLPLSFWLGVDTAYNIAKKFPESLKTGIPVDKIKMSNFKCYAPWSTVMIDPDGMTHICRDGISNGMASAHSDGMKKYNASLGTLGNIKKTPLKELWNNQIAQNWRKTIIELKELPPTCLSCCSCRSK